MIISSLHATKLINIIDRDMHAIILYTWDFPRNESAPTSPPAINDKESRKWVIRSEMFKKW